MNMEKEMAVHSSILAWSLVGFSQWDHKEPDTIEHAVRQLNKRGTCITAFTGEDAHMLSFTFIWRAFQ